MLIVEKTNPTQVLVANRISNRTMYRDCSVVNLPRKKRTVCLLVDDAVLKIVEKIRRDNQTNDYLTTEAEIKADTLAGLYIEAGRALRKDITHMLSMMIFEEETCDGWKVFNSPEDLANRCHKQRLRISALFSMTKLPTLGMKTICVVTDVRPAPTVGLVGAIYLGTLTVSSVLLAVAAAYSKLTPRLIRMGWDQTYLLDLIGE